MFYVDRIEPMIVKWTMLIDQWEGQLTERHKIIVNSQQVMQTRKREQKKLRIQLLRTRRYTWKTVGLYLFYKI